MENKLQEWTAPHLMRLNQADGTNKHLDLTEDVGGTALNITSSDYALCSQIVGGSGGAVAAGAVCGPS